MSQEKVLENKEQAEKYGGPVLQFLDAGRLDEIRDKLNRIEVGFGKYEGKTLAEIADSDEQYLEWLVSSDELLQRRGIFK